MRRTLTLTKETLAELSAVELTHVAGAAPTVAAVCGKTFTLTCWSEIDGCVTAQICGI
jgi:ribosomal protein L30E